MSRTLLFHRDFHCYSGGHGKVRDYFEHARAHPDWRPRVHFSVGREHVENPWLDVPDLIDPEWCPERAWALFLGGIDWLRYPVDLPAMPVVNLIQHVRHGDPKEDVYPFLARRAVRICVSEPVAQAILATGRVNGPVFVIEAGLRMPSALPLPERRQGVFIAALKQPELGRALAAELSALGHVVDLCDAFVSRDRYLQRLAASEIAVLLPNRTEGFYLPALEAMALGCATVVPDCVGNRAYLQPGMNALVPALELAELVAAVRRLGDPAARRPLVSLGIETAARFRLDRERQRFHEILDDLDALWRG